MKQHQSMNCLLLVYKKLNTEIENVRLELGMLILPCYDMQAGDQ